WRCGVSGGGAGEPSDQRRTGTNRTVGSNGVLSAPRMGEASSPAAHTVAWPCGTKNITCGSHGPAASSLTYPCFESMKENEPGSGAVNWPLSVSTRAFSIICALGIPASTHSVRLTYWGRTLRTAGGLKQLGPRSFGFQNWRSSNPAVQERCTQQTKPFLPVTAVS